jgi:transcriptional regulator GlxA family with amidase domain
MSQYLISLYPHALDEFLEAVKFVGRADLPVYSSNWCSVNPTHTYSDPPKDIDVLLVPGGGPGSQFRNVNTTIEFVRATYPKVKYLVTTRTGASITAQVGVLDGRRATTNKKAWGSIVAMGPKVK